MNENDFADKLLACMDCGEDFVFSAGEQAFYESKRLTEPKRCPDCRRLRRERLVPRVVQDG